MIVRQADIQNLAKLYSQLSEENLRETIMLLNELEHRTGVKWYPDFQEVEEWVKPAETKENVARGNSLMF